VTSVSEPEEGMVGRIPVRNLWFLMLYASDLARFPAKFKAMTEEAPAELPDLIARLLLRAARERLRRHLTRNYTARSGILSRVRGRINVLPTETSQLLSKGQIGCTYHELTVDIPRNRLIRAAFERLRRIVKNPELARDCRVMARQLGEMGINATAPSAQDLAKEQFGRNDSQDQLMIALARLVFEMALLTEEAGARSLYAPNREERWVRQLFEKAVFGFAQFELSKLGWDVKHGQILKWQFSGDDILPRMVTDIVLDSPAGQRLVIDTKFTSVMTVNQFGGESFKSNYVYQLYAYLRSQEGLDPAWDKASGMLLHPTVDDALNERVVVQGHSMRFATIDLRLPAVKIREELLLLLKESGEGNGTVSMGGPS
jgi:5-methylcytosine-specific restriction enzyme subunit McrC